MAFVSGRQIAARSAAALTVLAASVMMPMRASADEVVVGHLSLTPIENIKSVVPTGLKLSDVKPAAIVKEPEYRGKPKYGSIMLGNSPKSSVYFALDTIPGDHAPKLYIDIAGTGNLADRSANYTLQPLTEFATNTGSVTSAIAKGTANVPIGAMVPTIARYINGNNIEEMRYPVLFTLLGDELDYTVAVQRTGTISVNGRTLRISLVDTTGRGVFSSVTHPEDKGPVVKLLVDANDDGKFDPKKEAFDLAKPLRISGTAFELASANAAGTIIALRTTDKRPEGAITPDDLAVGSEIIDFVAKSIAGNTIKFPSGFKHKVVMLDFWATWCGPCVAEIPNIVNVYNQYHNNGFEIVGVSLDRANQKQTVIDFCNEHNMPWEQIYDGGYWNAQIAKLFGVDSIPRAFLVDGDTGVIVGMGDSIRGEGLTNALTRALTKKGLLRQQ
jgi:thiol-disulfide isomerase/thioredoxin